MGIFGTQKMFMCTLFFVRERGSQKVYGLYTHENVDIFPLNIFNVYCALKVATENIFKRNMLYCVLNIDSEHFINQISFESF